MLPHLPFFFHHTCRFLQLSSSYQPAILTLHLDGVWKQKTNGDVMRIHEGDFAYDLEQPVDPATQLRLKWRFTLYKVHPTEHKLSTGEAETREAAEKKALAALTRIAGPAGSRAA